VINVLIAFFESTFFIFVSNILYQKHSFINNFANHSYYTCKFYWQISNCWEFDSALKCDGW